MDYASDKAMPIADRVAAYLRTHVGRWFSGREIADATSYSVGYVNLTGRKLVDRPTLFERFETRLVPVFPWDHDGNKRREFRCTRTTW